MLRHIAIPALLGCLTLYVMIRSYCEQLVYYLSLPSEGMAGRVLGIAAASVLIMLLLHAVVVSRLAALVTGAGGSGPALLGIGADTWRIYASDLRLLLALGAYGVAILAAVALLRRAGFPAEIQAGFNAVAWLLLFWLVARAWFFLMPVSLQGGERGVLTMSWGRSRGHLLAIGIVMMVMLLLTLLLLGSGEYLLRLMGVLLPLPTTIPLVNAVGLFQRDLWPFVILISATYLCMIGLVTAARIRLHQELVAGELSAAPPA